MTFLASQGGVLIIDFGSQYTQLIARRVRQLHIFCEIVPHTLSCVELQQRAPGALILSGGPASVNDVDAPAFDAAILQLDVPILGICYGQQLLAAQLGGAVVAATTREYGAAQVSCVAALHGVGAQIFKNFVAGEPFAVWMSHGDTITRLPPDFVTLATTAATPYAAIAHVRRKIVGLQFHPEVSHTPRGMDILSSFLLDVAQLQANWTMHNFLQTQLQAVRAQVGEQAQVICALSGGVDSAVVAALLARAIGTRLHCIYVDHGLGRRHETAQVQALFAAAWRIPLHVVHAEARFLQALEGVVDPEQKRKIIGKLFIDVFETAAKSIAGAQFLAQGTLYPDVIESLPRAGGASVTIKSHHNVGGLPARMALQLVEPLRLLFKDEVRVLGEQLGLPHALCTRQPFPGPGLAVRIVGEVTAAQLAILQHADAIVDEEIRAANYYDKLWQSFAVLLPLRSVGVMGDARTFEQTIALRCVESSDGMTADWARLPHALLGRISQRISNEVHGINRVVYDISSKPPATIEWE